VSGYAVAQTQSVSEPQEKTAETISLQRQKSNQTESTVLHERFFDEACGTFAEPRFGYDFSLVPAHKDTTQRVQPSLRTGTMVQRYPVDRSEQSAPCATCSDEESSSVSLPSEPAVEPVTPAPEAAPIHAAPETEEESVAPEETAAPALLVEDSAAELAPGQMRKSEFLAQLRAAVTSTAEAAMAGTGRTTADCPYLDYWFDYYSAQDVQHGERALRRYAPEASSATTAREYIPIVAARVRRSVETWVRTGEVTGVTEGLPGIGLLGSIGSLVSGIGSIFRKARNGSARRPNNPQTIQAELGQGHPLDSGVRSHMETAFGTDFSQVRTHTDTTASRLSNRLNARAFTVGKHVAFGSGEYKPGTLYGDALIAHEMAHVVQQSGAGDSVVPMQTGDTSYNMLEKDADKSAMGAVASLWTGAKDALSDIAQNSIPRLRSGLALQRCAKTKLTFSTIHGPTPIDCGGFNWQIGWSIRNASSTTNGIIVQKVEIDRDVKDCSNSPVPYRAGVGLNPAWYPVWEAWYVNGGRVTPAVGRVNDIYGSTPLGNDTKGSMTVQGTAEFYNGATLPPGFVVTGAAPTHSLPATKTKPTLSGGTGAVDHSLTATWDCCTTNKSTTITTSSPP
jgi:hypothetical protein